MSGEVLLLNAAIGGITSAATGNDPLKGALLGAVGGGIASQIPALAGAVPGAGSAATAATPAATTAAATPAASLSGQSFAQASELANVANAANAASQGVNLANLGAVDGTASVLGSAPPAGFTGPPPVGAALKGAPPPMPAGFTPAASADKGMLSGLTDWWSGLSGKEKLMYGGAAGIGASMLAERMGAGEAPSGEYKGSLRRYRFDPFGYSPSVYAEGGIASLAAGGYDKMVGDMPMYASGGISDLGSYSDGGRMLKGPGDGMSDNIPGVIGGRRPARLADGEFVVPADVVSHLGNGSTDAGAKQLYAMMDRVRQKRTGTKKQGRQINARRVMPA